MSRRIAVGLVVLVGLVSCARVLGLRPSEEESFEHREHVLRGISCLRCHAGIVGAGDEGPLHVPDARACRSCHERPHDQRDCANCHGSHETRTQVAMAREQLRFTHKKHMPRVRGNCVRCHVGVAGEGEVLRPGMGVCLSCHEHEESFAVQDCAFCHVNLEEEHRRPAGHIVHDGDWRREHGVRSSGNREICQTCHSERFCASCHGATVPARPEELAFDDPMRPGVHRAGFRSRHPEEARGDPGLCTTCHSTDFCSDCHREHERSSTVEGPRTPHPAGWLGLRGERNDHGPAAWRDPTACAACHSGAGEALCIGCHREGGPGGNPHPAGWNEGSRSKRDPACIGCHEVGP
ncbi:MAG: hypothetical protein HYY06_29885 [Deltaproteobacteria bacterium]|nr:hypothetical protein [Deltaproteobacteria bacterium]